MRDRISMKITTVGFFLLTSLLPASAKEKCKIGFLTVDCPVACCRRKLVNECCNPNASIAEKILVFIGPEIIIAVIFFIIYYCYRLIKVPSDHCRRRRRCCCCPTDVTRPSQSARNNNTVELTTDQIEAADPLLPVTDQSGSVPMGPPLPVPPDPRVSSSVDLAPTHTTNSSSLSTDSRTTPDIKLAPPPPINAAISKLPDATTET